MKKYFLTLSAILLSAIVAHAATVTDTVNWTVTNTPVNPATHFRVEKNVSGTWTAVTTVAAPQLSASVTGLPVGTMTTYRVVPVRNGVDGTPSNTCTTGVLAPDSVLSATCSSTVVP